MLTVGVNYLMDEDFHAESESEVTAMKGSVVTVLEAEDPNNPGWVYVQCGSNQGFVPSDFLVADAPKAAAPSAYGGPPPPPAQGSYGAPPPAQGSYGAPPPAQGSYGAPPPAQGSATHRGLSSYGSSSYSTGAPPPAQGGYGSAPPPPPPAVGGPGSSYGGPPPAAYGSASAAPAYSGKTPQQIAAENEAKFRAEQRLISLELWEYRDELLGPCEPPRPAERRWFYRDFFGDIQGPFNMDEMRERLGKQYVNHDSKVLMEVSSGEVTRNEEELLRDLFRSPEAAFVESPRLTKAGGSCWFYVGPGGSEVGPFSSEQMRLWFDAGYMSGSLLVRLANGQSQMTPLKDVYPCPDDAFLSPPNLPGADASKFVKARTTVLTPPEKLHKKPQGPQDETSDKVEMMEEAPPPPPPPAGQRGSASASGAQEKSKKKDSKEVPVVVYGGGYPPFQGIPSPHNLKPNVYSSMLYTFLTRPLHPEAGTIQCYIRRDIDGSHINFNKYVLFLEETNTPIMAAFRHHHTIHNYYDIKMNTTGKLTDNARGLTISNLELNFGGTTFLLHNNVSGHQGVARDLACVTYEKNRVSNKGPRKMKVGIPMVREDKPEYIEWKHEGVKSAPMVQALKSITTKDLLPLLNKPPRWNEKKRAYMLDFKGRVTRSSVKNFQLVDALRDPEHKNVLMQHGRVGVNRFTMDVRHPLSVVQAFSIALSSLHSKHSVS